MNKVQIINSIKVVILTLVFSVGVQYVAAQTWAPPTSAPPAGNTYAPINVGPSGQVKDGGLTLGYTLPTTGTGLLVPTGMVGFGTTQPNSARSARLTVGQTETNTKGSNSLISFQSFPGSSLYYHITRLGTDHSLNFDSFAGNNTWVTPLSLLPNGQVRLSGGSPAVGKVLTATDTNGTATWQSVPIGRTSGTINDQESLTTKVPSGYSLSECTALVSPRVIGVQQSDKAMDYTVASFVGGGTVTCKYSWEDDGTLYAGTCNYLLICTK